MHFILTARRSLHCLLLCLVFGLPTFAQAADTPRDVVLILDNSGSMRKADPKFVLRESAAGFIDSLKDADRIAVIMFDERVEVLYSLGTADAAGRTAAKATLSKLDYRGRWTDSPRAVERAIYELKASGRPEAQLQALLMSDGVVDTGDAARNTQATDWLRKDLTNEAVKAKIRIFALAFTDKADTLLLQSLASRTEAEYARADRPDDLPAAFMRLADLMTRVVAAPTPAPVAPAPVPTVGPLAAVLGRSDAEAKALAEALGQGEDKLLAELRARGANPALFQGLDAAGLAATVGALVYPAPVTPPSPPVIETPVESGPADATPAASISDPEGEAALAKLMQLSEAEARDLAGRFKRPAAVLKAAVEGNGLEASHFDGLTLDDKTALLEEFLKGLPAAVSDQTEVASQPMTEPTSDPIAAARSNPLLLAGAGGGFVLLLALGGWLLLRPRPVGLMAAAAVEDARPAAQTGAASIPEAYLTDNQRITGKARHDLGKKPLVIGRIAGNDPAANDYLVIEQATVGRRHALIEFRDIAFYVVDQGSVNGTFVNGEQLPSEGARRLKDGDRVKFHRYEFQFAMPRAEADDMEKTRIAQAPGDATIIADRTVVAATATLIQGAAALQTSATELARPAPPPPQQTGATVPRPEPQAMGEGTNPTVLRTPEPLSRAESGAGDALDMFMATNMFAASLQATPPEPAPAPEGGTVVLPAPLVTLDPSEVSLTHDPSGFGAASSAGSVLPEPVLADPGEFADFAAEAPPLAAATDAIEAAPADLAGFFDEPAGAEPMSPVARALGDQAGDFFGTPIATDLDMPVAETLPPEALPPSPPSPPVGALFEDDLLMGGDRTVLMGDYSPGPASPFVPPPPPMPAPPTPPLAAADTSDVTVMPGVGARPVPPLPRTEGNKPALDDFDFDAFVDDDKPSH